VNDPWELALRETRMEADLPETIAERFSCLLLLLVTGTLVGLVLAVRDADTPYRLKRRRTQLDVTGVGASHEVDVPTVARIVVEDDQAVIKHPEVVTRECNRRHQWARHPPVFLTCVLTGSDDAVCPTLVIG